MISIIVCTQHSDTLSVFKDTIKQTIGVEYELVIVDNSDNLYSIFTAYNKGLEICRFPYVCFVHDDVLFRTQDWGQAVCKHLNDPTCGIIGVCGGSIYPRVPTAWSFVENTKYILQSDKVKSKTILYQSQGYNNDSYKQVATLDGVFLCARKSLFDTIRFDDSTFEGFHCYDIDICLQALSMGLENRAINNVLIEHFSHGSLNRQWIENSLLLVEKWNNYLPIKLMNISDEAMLKKEYHYMITTFVKRMVRANYSNKAIINVLEKSLRHHPRILDGHFQQKILLRLFLTRLTKKPATLLKRV